MEFVVGFVNTLNEPTCDRSKCHEATVDLSTSTLLKCIGVIFIGKAAVEKLNRSVSSHKEK